MHFSFMSVYKPNCQGIKNTVYWFLVAKEIHKQNNHWNLCARESDEDVLKTCRKTKMVNIFLFVTLLLLWTFANTLIIGIYGA